MYFFLKDRSVLFWSFRVLGVETSTVRFNEEGEEDVDVLQAGDSASAIARQIGGGECEESSDFMSTETFHSWDEICQSMEPSKSENGTPRIKEAEKDAGLKRSPETNCSIM